MDIYLPIAEMSVNLFLLLGLGGAVGFLSGVFGVGGGFLMTPLLIFIGIPPAVAVGSEASQILASSFSGTIAHSRRGNVDFRMGAVLVLGGFVGSAFGVWLFAQLRQMGQIDLVISLAYVVFLGTVGALMLVESVQAWFRMRARRDTFTRRHRHLWLHGMPTAVVVGTSLFQISFVTAVTTWLHAVNNYTVDVVLALALIVGGVIGAQFGSSAGAHLRGEQLRILLALIVLAVCTKLGYDLIALPEDLYSLGMVSH